MAELEKAMTLAGFDSKRSVAFSDVQDLTSAASAENKQQQHQEKQSQPQDGKKGKKAKKKAENESKTIDKKDLLKSLLDRVTKGDVSQET